MTRTQLHLKLNQFWLRPILVGCCLALGYEITKRNLVSNANSNQVLEISEQKQRTKHDKYNSLNVGKETRSENYNPPLQKIQPSVIPIIQSNSTEKLHIPQSSNAPLNSIKEEKLKSFNPNIKRSEEDKQEYFDHDIGPDLFNLEAESFFKEHSIDEMLETLPNLKKN